MGLKELQNIRDNRDVPKEKKKYVIPKISKKRAAQIEKEKASMANRSPKERKQIKKSVRSSVRSLVSSEGNKEVKGSAELNRWFLDRRKEMTGYCHHCSMASCKNDDKFFKFSICHILPKAYFPSIATHPLNFIELCFWNNSCHSQMDNKMLDLTEMACWDEIVTKFCKMFPHIAKTERRRIPEVLLQYIEAEK